MIVAAQASPYVLGNDVAGEVFAIGSSVTKVRPGDRVLACAERGCFQKFNIVEQSLFELTLTNSSLVNWPGIASKIHSRSEWLSFVSWDVGTSETCF